VAGAPRGADVSHAAVAISSFLLWIEILAATSTLQIALTATSDRGEVAASSRG
jgi:hypothetical protein